MSGLSGASGTAGIRTRIWAHRGASAQAPENTLPAFDLAIRLGSDGIELDVQRTADGILVVTHDTDCLRLTGEPVKVALLDLAELKRMNYASRWPEASFVPLPALAEVFDLVKSTGLVINVELKNDEEPYEGMEADVLKLIEEFKMEERICLSSFNHASMACAAGLIRSRGLAIPCGLLFSHRLKNPWELAGRLGAAAIHPRCGLVRQPEYVSAAHAAGIRIHTWTADRPDQLEDLMRLGVDAVITNRPDLALQVRAGLAHRG